MAAQVDSADVSYEPAVYDPQSGTTRPGRYYRVSSPGTLVQYVNPANAVDGAVASNGTFVAYEGDPADYVAVVPES